MMETRPTFGMGLLLAVVAANLAPIVFGEGSNCTTGQPTGIPFTTSTSLPAESPEMLEPLQKGMLPVYEMTNYFLETVLQPSSIVDLDRELDLSDFQAVEESLKSDWQFWIKHYYQYAICWCLAVVYIIAVPLSACIVCCCRSRGRCGGKTISRDRKDTNCNRRCCSFLLIVITVLMLFGVVCMFISNELIYEMTEPSGIPETLSTTVSSVDNFRLASMTSLRNEIRIRLENELRSISSALVSLPGNAQEVVGDITGTGVLFWSMQAYVNGLNMSRNALLSIDTHTSAITAQLGLLQSEVSEFKENMTNGLAFCENSNQDCSRAIQSISRIIVPSNSTPDSFQDTAVALDSALGLHTNLWIESERSRQEYDSIQDSIRNSSESITAEISSQNAQITTKATDFINTTSAFLDQFSTNEAKSFVNETINPWIVDIGRYRYFAGIGLSTMTLLIVTLCVLGILYGVCGDRATAHAQCCNRRNAAKFLRASLVFIYVFCIILMLVTSLLLVLGGIPHNDACRHLVKMSDDPALDVIDRILNKVLNVSVEILDLYRNCADDEALYTAARIAELGPGYDVSALLNISQYDIPEHLDALSTQTYHLGPLQLLSDDLEVALRDISSVWETVDLSPHTQFLDAISAVRQDLKELVGFLSDAAARSSSTEAISSLFSAYSSQVERLEQTHFSELSIETDLLSEALSLAKDNVDFKAEDFISGITAAQGGINPSVLQEAVSESASSILILYSDMVTEVVAAITQDVARCGSLYDVTSELVNDVCFHFLYPFNAFWFSVGWGLFFYILLIPVAMKLADYYVIAHEYDPEAEILEVPFEQEAEEFEPPDTVQNRNSRDWRWNDIPEASVSARQWQDDARSRHSPDGAGNGRNLDVTSVSLNGWQPDTGASNSVPYVTTDIDNVIFHAPDKSPPLLSELDYPLASQQSQFLDPYSQDLPGLRSRSDYDRYAYDNTGYF